MAYLAASMATFVTFIMPAVGRSEKDPVYNVRYLMSRPKLNYELDSSMEQQ